MLPTRLFRHPRRETALSPATRDFGDMFNDFFNWGPITDWPASEDVARYPVDIREENGDFIVDAEMPGFTPDEVDVSIEQGILNISAEHRDEPEVKGKKHLHERRYHRVERSFTLPGPIVESSVDAKLKDGVLHMVLHKSEAATPHKISVK